MVWPDSTVVVTAVGASGSVGVVGDTGGRNGVMGLAIVAHAPRPTAVTAATRNMYAVKLVRPVMEYPYPTTPDASLAQDEPPSSERSMVYEITGSPPLLPGALHVNVAARSPAVATKVCGAVAVAAGIADTAGVIALSPIEFVAARRNISVAPFVKPVTV